MKTRRKRVGITSAALLGLYGLMPSALYAQNVVHFSTSDAGQTRSIAEWGVEVVVYSADDMRQSIAHMGAQNINLIAVNFWLDEPLQANGQIGPNSRAKIDAQLAIAAMSGNRRIILGPNVGDTHASYMSGGQALPSQWVRLLQGTKSYLNSRGFTFGAAMPFNEPDFWSGQGTPQNLRDIMVGLRNDPNFNGVALVGASTLSSNPAQFWYDAIRDVATHGSAHGLGGSADAYANFFEHVRATGRIGSAPELHSLGEAIYSAQYGAQSAQWWRAARRARGLFVQTSDGKQLGYAENRGDATAATVYRPPDGNIRAFAGGFERLGRSTAYRLVSTDRDVYFNGVGPMREYMVQAGGSEEAYADIDVDNNILPALDGYRWKIVNQNGQVMEVAGGGTGDGALIRSASDTNSLNQKWNIVRTKDGYYQLFNANSGRTAEVAFGSLDNGASVRQWGMADNLIQHWYIDDAGDGSYYLRNGHSNKYLTSNTGNSFQTDNTGSNLQKWRFVLANPNAPARAQYAFQGNATSSTGTFHGVASGNPTYGTGPTGQGQAINLDGVNDYVTLPAGVATSQNITIAAHVKWDGGNAWQRIFDFGNDTQSYMMLTPRSGEDTMRFAITTSGPGGEQILDTSPLPTGQWVHLALTLGGNTGVLYVDGKPRVAGQFLLDPSHVNPALNYIGKSQFADPLFDGMVDDFRVYDYALHMSQVASFVFHRWTGELNSTWTTAAQSNPKNCQHNVAAADYANGNAVLFDDFASRFTVNLTDGAVSPASIQFDNARNDYVLNGPGAITGSGVLTKIGAGALTITNANTYSGGTALNAGTLNVNNASAIGTGPLTIATGATIDNTSGSPVTLSTSNAQIWNGDFTFGGSNGLNMGTGAVTLTGNRTVTVNGAGALTIGRVVETGGARQLTKAGPGTLVLTGNSTYTGDTNVTGGTLTAAGSLNSPGADVWVGQGAGGSGHLNVPAGGTVTANVLLVGAGGSPAVVATGTGALASGGTINTRQWFVLGHSGAVGSSGSFTVNGGTLNVHTNPAAFGNLEVGTFDAANATLDINAGSTVRLLNNASIVFGAQGNHTGTSVINHNGGDVTFYADNGAAVGGTGRVILASAANPTGAYTYNLNGGTLTVPRILRESTAGNPTTVFNFNGGTLRAARDDVDLVSNLSAANVRAGGARIDSNGMSVRLSQRLLHDATLGQNVDGGLTKLGAGTLRLSGANTYTGPTTVSAGTLLVTGTHTGAGAYTVAAAASLGGTGTIDTAADNPVTVTGVLAPGIPNASPGRLTVRGPYAQQPTGRLEIEISPVAHDVLAVEGPAALAGSLATVLSAGYAPDWGDRFTVMTFASRVGTFATRFTPGADPDHVFVPLYGATDVTLEYARLGDANLDGAVSVADVGILATNFGAAAPADDTAWLFGDFTGDGLVTISEVGLLATNFGAVASVGETPDGVSLRFLAAIDQPEFAGFRSAMAAVPEPFTSLAGGAALSIMAVSRRRRNRRCGQANLLLAAEKG